MNTCAPNVWLAPTIIAEYGFKILPYHNGYCQGHRTDLHKSFTNPKNIKKHKLSIVGRKNYTLPQLICQEKLLCRFYDSTNPTFDTDAPR